MKKVCFPALAVLLVSCVTNETSERIAPAEAPSISSGCYRMAIDRDTAYLKMELNGNDVSGNLVYDGWEKDDNRGTISGRLSGNKITLWYRYQSEGVWSVRQVIYKVGNNVLYEGYGEFEGSEDSAVFRFPDALRYEENHPYQKIPCNEAKF